MLAMATGKLKATGTRLGEALRETRDRLTPRHLLLRTLVEAELRDGHLPALADNDGQRLVAYVTRARRDILEAQRLRYRVFTSEYGARFDGPDGLDQDHYDRHCRHVVVKDTATGRIVGYTRVLTDERARRAGGWYSAGEFELGMVDRLDGRVLEIGRTCVHPDYRSGATIAVLWGRLAQLLLEEGYRYLFGCASIPLNDPAQARAMLDDVARRATTDASLRVTPKVALPALARGEGVTARMPPLLRTYLRMGAVVCGEPCWDPDFNCADLFVLVDVQALPERYVQHFMARRGQAALAA